MPRIEERVATMIPDMILEQIDSLLEVRDTALVGKHVGEILDQLRLLDAEGDPEVRYLRGWLMFIDVERRRVSGTLAECSGELEAAIRLGHSDGRAWLYLGYVQEEAGDFARALNSYQRAAEDLSVEYLRGKALERLAVVYIRTRSFDYAVRAVESYATWAEATEIQDVWPDELDRALAETWSVWPEGFKRKVLETLGSTNESRRLANWFSVLNHYRDLES